MQEMGGHEEESSTDSLVGFELPSDPGADPGPDPDTGPGPCPDPDPAPHVVASTVGVAFESHPSLVSLEMPDEHFYKDDLRLGRFIIIQGIRYVVCQCDMDDRGVFLLPTDHFLVGIRPPPGCGAMLKFILNISRI